MKRQLLTHLLKGAGILAISGCANTQVSYNTLDIASTYDTLITKQVVFNILKTRENPTGIPAFVKVASQSAQTTDAVNPTLAFPFSPQTTLTQTAASITSGKSLQTAARGLSLQLQAQWNSNYSISPVDDPDQLRRIRSIYQYVTGNLTEEDFEADYPIIQVSGTSAASSSKTIVSGSFAGSPFKVTIGGEKPDANKKKYVRRACHGFDKNGNCQWDWIGIKPDLTFIQPPGCVMCDYNTPLSNYKPGVASNLYVLEKNCSLYGPQRRNENERGACPVNPELQRLFFYEPGEFIDRDAIAIASNGLTPLYVRGENGRVAFNELALFTQEAASQGTGSPTSGGQSDGRKTEPLQRISVPVGALTTTAP